MALNWKGDKLISKVQAAQKTGLNRTLGETVEHAKNNHEWINRNGFLEGSIKILELAHRAGTGFRGTWGSVDVVYALIHELGGKIVPKKAPALRFQVGGQWVTTQEVNIPARPYLRPAADAVYPRLAENIRRALRGS